MFWTRTSGESNTSAILNEEERAKKRETGKQEMSEEERETMKKVSDLIKFSDYGHADMPEGTIITEPYFSDVIVSVTTQARLDKAAARANQ